MQAELLKIRISDLVPHERIQNDEIRVYVTTMLRTGVQKRPIVVHRIDGESRYLILDGHHRVQALREMGCQYVMASKVDYFSPKIRARSWENSKLEWDKSEVLRTALRGELVGPKATKHQVLVNGRWVRFRRTASIMPVINQPIEDLR
jgi:L-serine kinase (ADP)